MTPFMSASMNPMSVTQARPLHYRLKPEDQLCLLHIPKTAGSTLTSIVDTNFHVNEIFPASTVGRFSPDELEQYKLFRDHFDYNIHRFFKKKPYYMTILRDPIDRAISLYEFWKRSRERNQPDNKPMSELLQDATLEGLTGFICHSDPQVRSRTSNRQVRQLAIGIGGLSTDPSAAFSDDELLAMAKKNLDDCLFVALTERFQDSVFLMAYVFGWYPIADYQSLRVASKRSRKEDIPQEDLRAIAQVNQLDIALYEYGCERFRRDYAQMLDDLRDAYGLPTQGECDRLLAGTATPEERLDFLVPPLEQHYERCYAEHPPAKPVKVYDFNCLQPLYGTGWHRRNGKKNGVIITDLPFRWTGPSPLSTMDVPLEPGEDLTLRIQIINAIAPDVLNSLTIRANGHTLQLSPLEKRNNSAILQGVIAKEWLDQGRPFTRLELEVNRTASPNSIDPDNPDTRLVGLAVHRIHIFPTAAAIATDQFTFFRFPDTDPLWTDIVEFLTPHIRDDERMAALGEFSKKFPKQFCSFIEPFYSIPQVNWVVIHKGEYQNLDPAALTWTLRTLKPVFANRVFVVFSNREDVPAISPLATHVLTLSGRIWTQRLEQMGILPPKARRAIARVAKAVLAPVRLGS